MELFDINEWIKDFFLYPSMIDTCKWKEIFDEMAVHTRKATPTKLMCTRRPNEVQEVFDYRIANYEPITYGSMNKAFDSLFRLMNGVNYNLVISDDLRKYIDQKLFRGLNLEQFLSNIVLKRDIEDPNGFLLWYPSGEGVISSDKKVQAKPKLVYSFDLHYADDDVFSFLSHEKSKIKKDGKWVLEGNVYWIFDKMQFHKLKQVGKNASKLSDYELVKVYDHGLKDIPVIVLGGNIDSDGVFQSFFAPYCAFGNEAIRQFSDWQAALTTTVHPAVEEFQTSCGIRVTNMDSNRVDPDNDGTTEKYSYNHKIDLIPMSKSPHNTTIRKVPDGSGVDGILDASIPFKRFIAPPVENARYCGESWEKLVEKAEDALHLNLGKSNQSGAAKEIDKEAHYSMITKIGNNYFDNIMLNSLKYINGLVFPVTGGSEQISINKPSTFKVKTESDLIDEIGTLTEKKVPSLFLNSATIDLSKKYFSGDDLNKKIFSIIVLEDPLYIYNTVEKESQLMSKVISREAYIRSVYMYSILLKIANEMGVKDFIVSDNEKIMIEFEQKIIEFIPEEPTPLFVNNPEPVYN